MQVLSSLANSVGNPQEAPQRPPAAGCVMAGRFASLWPESAAGSYGSPVGTPASEQGMDDSVSSLPGKSQAKNPYNPFEIMHASLATMRYHDMACCNFQMLLSTLILPPHSERCLPA